MLNKNIAELDDYFLFVTLSAVFDMIWSDFEIGLFMMVLFAITMSAFHFNVYATIGSIVQVIFIVAQLIS
jgi:hypothetical protein